MVTEKQIVQEENDDISSYKLFDEISERLRKADYYTRDILRRASMITDRMFDFARIDENIVEIDHPSGIINLINLKIDILMKNLSLLDDEVNKISDL